jgi:GT2 family glycosyltransferase
VRVPDVTVVIPTHARAARLRTALAALVGEDVIVVADGATAEVHEVIAAAGVRCVRVDPGRGPAAARNAGWRAAASEYVAFTDDDCLPAPGWTAALLAAAAPDVAVQGRVEPLPAERDRLGPFARTLVVDGAGPFFQTANMLYPRAVLERLGGFDETFAQPAGEDTDLGWRARAAGVEIRFADDALVWHAVHTPGWRGLVRDAPRWGSAIAMVRNHPGIRAHFHHRWFWKPSHERLLLAAAGVALARRTRGASLAAVAPWVLVHRGEHPTAAALARALPAHLAVDAAEVGALARGSLQTRTLLL